MRSALLLAISTAACAATLDIPAASGPLTIDGVPDEAIWTQARVLPLRPAGFSGASFPEGGEVRAIVRSGYLCIAARLPEPDRISAYTHGPVAALGREDAVTFTFRVKPAAPGIGLATLTVAALGGFRTDFAARNAPDAGRILANAKPAPGAWTLEAAIPLTSFAELGFLYVERVRVPRPEAPELRWAFPALNERAEFQLAKSGEQAQPPSVAPSQQGPAVAAAETARGSGMLREHVGKRLAEAAAEERRAWEAVRTRADWEKFRAERLGNLRASFGPMPARTPLRAAVTRRLDLGDGFVIENIAFESRPHLLVAANLYLPAKVTGRIPAVVIVHSHHAPRTQLELQDMGMTWARAGVAVLVMDQLGAGERVQSNPWPRESYHARYAMGMQFLLIGDTLMKWMAWDLMRGIDMLLERPYIDPKRIVMIGSVAGGGDPAAVTAALDPRIAAVAPFNFGEAGPEEHYTTGPRPYDAATADPGSGSWETTRNLWRSASGQFFPWFICASVAPRAFLYSFEINWPKTVEEEPAWARYKRVFELMGARDRLDSVHGFGPFPGPGEFTNVGVHMRKAIYPVLKRWLDVPEPAEEYRNIRPDSDLAAITPALAADRQPWPAVAVARTVLRERKHAPASIPQLRKELAAKLGDIEPAGAARLRDSAARTLSGFTLEVLSLEAEPGIQLPALLLKPAQPAVRAPAVLAFAQEGSSAFLRERTNDLRAIVDSGAFVCIADLRGSGGSNRGPGGMGLAATELMLGNTLVAGRVKDARSVLRYLAARPEIDPARIALWGDSFADVNPQFLAPYESLGREIGPNKMNQAEPMGQLVALFTAVFEDRVRAVATSGGLSSFASVLEDRFCYIPLDAVVPGILQITDLPEIAAALKPRPVLQRAQVDGRNRALPETVQQPIGTWLASQLR